MRTKARRKMKKKPAKKKLTPLQREIKRRESAVARNTRSIERARNLCQSEVDELEQKNRTHYQILLKLKN